MRFHKLFAFLGLTTTLVFGATGSLGAWNDFGSQRSDVITATLDQINAEDEAIRREQAITRRNLEFLGVFQELTLNKDGIYPTNENPHKIVFSIVDRHGVERQFLVDRALVLRYSSLLRELSAYAEIGEVVPILNTHKPVLNTQHDPAHFKTLIRLLFEYDSNRVAYDNGLLFDLKAIGTQEDVYGVLHLFNFLFSNNVESRSDGFITSNDTGFLHALLKTTAPYIFDLKSIQMVNGHASLLVPYDLYNKSLGFARPLDVYRILIGLEPQDKDLQLKTNHALLLEDLRAYCTPNKRFLWWKSLKNLTTLSEKDSQALANLDLEFIRFSDITDIKGSTPQAHIVMTLAEFDANKDAVDRFFLKDLDKTLIIDFGNATTIRDDFIIPESIKQLIIVGEQITTVGNNFLADCMNLSHLDLSNTQITHVRDRFLLRSGVNTVTLPNTLRVVGSSFLADCMNLSHLDLSNTQITTVGYMFLGDSGVTTVTLPDALRSVGDHFLFRCRSLSHLDLSNTQIITVGISFLLGSGVTTVTLPDSLMVVGDYFLFECKNLGHLDLSNTQITSVRDDFLRDSSVTTVTLPDTLRSVGDRFLMGCKNLGHLDLSKTQITTVHSGFLRDSSVTTVTLPNTLRDVRGGFLMGCKNLGHLDLSNTQITTVWDYFLTNSGVNTVTLPNTLATVGIWFLSNCNRLEAVYASRVMSAWNAVKAQTGRKLQALEGVPVGEVSLLGRLRQYWWS